MNNSQVLSQSIIDSHIDQLTTLSIQITELVTGLSIDELPQEDLNSIVEQSLQIYLDFVNQYVEEIFGKRTGIQLQILQSKEDLALIDRFAGMSDHLKEAHNMFVTSLQS